MVAALTWETPSIVSAAGLTTWGSIAGESTMIASVRLSMMSCQRFKNLVPGQSRSDRYDLPDGNTKNEIRLNITEANIPPPIYKIPQHFQGSINSVNFWH